MEKYWCAAGATKLGGEGDWQKREVHPGDCRQGELANNYNGDGDDILDITRYDVTMFIIQSGVVRVKIEGDNEPSPSVPRQVRILIQTGVLVSWYPGILVHILVSWYP